MTGTHSAALNGNRPTTWTETTCRTYDKVKDSGSAGDPTPLGDQGSAASGGEEITTSARLCRRTTSRQDEDSGTYEGAGECRHGAGELTGSREGVKAALTADRRKPDRPPVCRIRAKGRDGAIMGRM